jgi:hypothetical protein
MWIESRDFDSMNWISAQIGAREHCVGEKSKSEKRKAEGSRGAGGDR